MKTMITRNNVPRHNGTMTCRWEFWVITPEAWAIAARLGVEACRRRGRQWKRTGSQWKPVEAVGKRVGDKEGVGRGAGGSGEVREVRKVVGKCGRGRKAQEVTVRYSTFLLRPSPQGQNAVL